MKYSKRVVVIILGGGQGTRLYPLTKERAKPAVPFGTKYRIVDIPISNSINSNLNNIYVLTQFNSASLNMHISSTYVFDSFSGGFVEVLAAEQSFKSKTWYEGTADAVRKTLHHFEELPHKPEYFLILSGDQLYSMNFWKFIDNHIEKKADVSIAVTPVDREKACGFGIVNFDKNGRINSFIEKPSLNINIDNIKIPDSIPLDKKLKEKGRELAGSMGIYCFSAKVLYEAMENNSTDFGKEIIPSMIDKFHLQSFLFTGFWEDIGTIKSFYETNLELVKEYPSFYIADPNSPIYSRKLNLPPSKFMKSTLNAVLSGDGSKVENSNIKNSILGVRSIIRSESSLDEVVFMGADFYQDDVKSKIKIGIGKNTHVKGAIIDKNVRIGNDCKIGLNGKIEDGDYGNYHVKDGIIVISKGSIIEDGTII